MRRYQIIEDAVHTLHSCLEMFPSFQEGDQSARHILRDIFGCDRDELLDAGDKGKVENVGNGSAIIRVRNRCEFKDESGCI